MALWWYTKILCRPAAVCVSLLLTSLLCLMSFPVQAEPPCPQSCSCPSVKDVHCTFRHLTAVPKNFPKDTERLNLGYNSLTELEVSDFRSLRQLEMLLMHGNDINVVHPRTFYSLRSLQILKLSYNKLPIVKPGLFDGLVGLVRLHLDHNLISFIEPYSFSGLTSLKLLQLEGNLLKELHPHTFITVSLLGNFWTSGLKHLHLSDNLLEHLPATVLSTSPKLEILTLNGNPWTCDCQLHWLLQWSSTHEGVIKCKKERETSTTEICPQCFSPQPLNGTHIFALSENQLTCERPVLRSSLKLWDNPLWAESDTEPDLPYTRDFEKPLGHLSFVFSDSHGNNAHVDCEMRHPGDSSDINWTINPRSAQGLSVNVSLATILECEIDREKLQNLWQLVAYYYESPAILERGQQRHNTSRATYQYAQVANENSPYFTDLKGYLVAEPAWLLQHRVTLKLNRQQTTTKKLVMDFTTIITRIINSHRRQQDDDDLTSSWAMIDRGTAGRVKTALEGSKVHLQCSVVTSQQGVKVEWMLPDLSIVDSLTNKLQIDDTGDLVIMNASQSDSGLYHCMIKTKAGVDLISLRLTIKERLPSPSAFNGQKIIVEKGGSISLPCEVISVQPSQTIWYMPTNKVLLPTQKTRKAAVMQNGTLVVRKLMVEDSGEYSCLASNLYGVDMLSHMVEVTGEELPYNSEEKTETRQNILNPDIEEGSAGDYQETIRSFATQAPTLGNQQSNPDSFSNKNSKRDFKRKPTIIAKTLEPNYWAEVLAKANSKLPIAQDPELPLLDSTTVSALDSLPNPATPISSYKIANNFPITTTSNYWKESTTEESRPKTSQTQLIRSTESSLQNISEITEKNNRVTLIVRTPAEKTETLKFGSGNRKFIPGRSNRRRPPFRRRKPPARKIIPDIKSFLNSSIALKSNAPPPMSTIITTTTNTTSSWTTSEQITVTPYYQIEQVGDNENSESMDERKESNSETHNPVQDLESTQRGSQSVSEKEIQLKNSSDVQKNATQRRLKTIITGIGTQTMNTALAIETESPKNELVTQSYDMSDNILSISTSQTPKSNILPSFEQISPTQAKVASHKVIFNDSDPSMENLKKDNIHMENKEVNNAKAKSENPYVPSVSIHPWLHQYRQVPEQPNSAQMPHIHKDRNLEKLGDVDLRSPPLPPHIVPTSYWPSNHHHYPIYPQWPGQRSFPHPKHGAAPYILPTHETRLFPHGQAQNLVATNRPEITDKTLKPTTRTIEPTLIHSSDQNNPLDVRTQIRDQLLLSKLRNRYRQAYIDRLSQLGKIVTPKPRINNNNPPNQIQPSLKPLARPSLLRPPVPTHSSALQPTNISKPTASSFSDYNLIPHAHHATTPGLQQEVHLPVRGAGVGRTKPRITTVNKASVSVLAEGDVVLHCEATGIPEPSISWTKVSTGATIPANNKHGSRFEVFKNGTFVIKTVQLQDRGQYLCTAQNKFGSDRMVITLAVQTEAPKIQPPRSTEIANYFGKGVSLDCLASGKPPAHISWILPDGTFVREIGTINSPISKMSLLENGTLQMQSTNFSSKGDYKCIASNAAGADTVTYHLHVAALPPSISEAASDTLIIPTGRNVYVHCSMKGEPLPTLKWTLPSGIHVRPSQFLGHKLFVFPNGTLYFKNVLPADAGRYECSATNTVGIAKRTVRLEVRADSSSHFRHPSLPFPPTHHAVPSRQHSVSAMYGSAVYLHCPESIGSPRGTVWQLPSKIIMEHHYSPERPIKVFRNGTLRILQLTELDGGNYLCFFQRPNGEDMEVFRLDVLMTPPRIEHVRTVQPRVSFGENVQVDCVATGLPDPEVSWSLPDGTLVNNALQSDDSGYRNRRYVIFGNGTLLLQQMDKKDEGDYTCYAKNKLGKDERKVSVKVGPNAPRITFKFPSQVTVKYGEIAQLSCQATGEPTPQVFWISPRNEVIPTFSDKFEIVGNGMLVVKKVTLTDEGKYACVARNSAGDDIKNIILEVESKQPVINGNNGKSVKKVTGISYQTVLLDCKVEGKPEPKVWWVTPYGQSLQLSYLSGRFQVHQNGSLEVRGVRKTDEGRYMCLAKNQLGEASLLVELDVAPIAEKPSFAVPNIELLSIKDNSGELYLHCLARGKPNPEYVWILPNGTALMPGVKLQRFTHHQGNGTLWIHQLSANDKGVYRCLAKNVAGQAEKRYALEAGRKPVIRGPTGGIKITYGQTLNLHCITDGWPQASIAWTLPNGFTLDKPQSIGRVTFHANGTLQMRQIATFDKGTYICKASNSFGTSTLSYPITVMVHPPRITGMLPSITRVNRGSPVKLNCVATGVPKPEISWTLPGRTTLIPHNRYIVQGGIHMTEDGSLVIQNPVLMNSGIYKCNAKNALGTDFKSTYIQVI
ncbi:matrix-remodeling-associated protein 5 isoform X2 [Corythoichthys intestinalis]|uniref:matrix-remodeling-associated protein 5 isoform X2 n=1 Tax=Corythoichthys intestinalis TaxID=161448 RepID=UPI0025A5BF80|nr:matrix-remodeling-associated protein 5 isoform X2 [Corythoichthys intestinalis]XP_061793198.1 matrix-remodeling-associated protein 5-like [Nerophis lumbriciformis]